MENGDGTEHLFSDKNPNSVLDLSIGAPGPEILIRLPGMFAEGTCERMKGKRSCYK